MRSRLFLHAFYAALLAAAAFPAQAGILADIKVSSASHVNQYDEDDGRPAIPFEGALASSLEPLNMHRLPSCRSSIRMGLKYSRCFYAGDFSGLVSPYETEFKSRFKTDVPMGSEFYTELSVGNDGNYFGTFSFVETKVETHIDQTGTYQSTLNTNYQFWYEGAGIAPATVIDNEFVKRIWNAGMFTKQVFFTQWDVLEVSDVNNPRLTEFEQWRGDFESATSTVPEPSAPLLFATGLLAMALRRVRR
jgi:hypothetical protein